MDDVGPFVEAGRDGTDAVLHTHRASYFLQERGLWQQWIQGAPHRHGDDGISTYLGGIRLACDVISECADN
ncbi:hypothetical protein [Streptomyces sp. 039-1]|uniref:hypothetical protein n=1 Tax=Streptomyces sp. 039-1 TaxID=2789263 RepID=UPI0039F4982F